MNLPYEFTDISRQNPCPQAMKTGVIGQQRQQIRNRGPIVGHACNLSLASRRVVNCCTIFRCTQLDPRSGA
eukprot:1391976-Amorphochlora_amoeboformis.AAC.1